jgi:hypothetical protein
MSTHDDAFTAEAKSLAYTFRAKAGTKPTWTPRWGFVTDEPRFDPRFKIGGQFGGWFYGVRAYGGHGWEVGGAEAKRGPEVNEYSDFAGVLGTGVYVTGVAGTSVNNVGVYGQTGEVPDLPFPVPYYVRAAFSARRSRVVASSVCRPLARASRAFRLKVPASRASRRMASVWLVARASSQACTAFRVRHQPCMAMRAMTAASWAFATRRDRRSA